MCGLAGLFGQDAAAEIDTAVLRRMTGALRHRGPDGDGFHVEPGIGLGHRRLAVIDVEAGGQPMYNEDGSVVIVFNGMIYNHAALRETLLADGHAFRTRCDTETIIHAWEKWGVDCVRHLSGMFAFALWDRHRRMLFLARDRLGKKPLHYMRTADGGLAFASELCAFAALPGQALRIDPRAVDDFFAYGYVPDPGTIFQGIRKLPAAHYLLLEAGMATRAHAPEPRPQRYWRAAPGAAPTTEAEATPALLDHLRRTVGARMIADVPLGAFLSGGVDSGAIVATAAALRATPLDTFTIGFPGDGDERPFAAMVAARYGTAHHADASSFDYIAAARTQAAMFGEPFGDSSAVPTHAVCALARRTATVALSGDGGDEVLGGYRRYQWHLIAEAVRTYVPAPLRRGVIGRLARAYPKLDRAPRWLRAKHTLTEISLDSALGYYNTVCKVHHDRRHALFSAAMEAALGDHDPASRITAIIDQCDDADPLRQAQMVDIETYLPGDILTKVDRASMAVSLEVRAPLLDHEFVAWGLGLPASLKQRDGSGKYLLKRAMEPFLPREILYRDKQGFAMPLAEQLRTGTDRVRALLLGDVMLESGLFDPDTLGQLIDEHAARAFDHSGVLWLLLVFEGFLANVARIGVTGDVASPVPMAAQDA